MSPTRRVTVSMSFVAILALGACAAPPPPPEPIYAQPTYDKSGTPVFDCRPADQPITASYPAHLPICETGGCPGGSYRVTTGQGVMCVEYPREEGSGDSDHGQTAGARG